EASFAHGVERAVPVDVMRPAAELNGHALVRRVRARERVTRVPASCRVDARRRFARLDDALHQAGGAHALEDHRRRGDPAVLRHLAPYGVGRTLAWVHTDVRAELPGKLEALGVV